MQKILSAEEIKRFRFENHLTQEDLAKAIGVTTATISSLERSVHHTRKSTMQKLQDYFFHTNQGVSKPGERSISMTQDNVGNHPELFGAEILRSGDQQQIRLYVERSDGRSFLENNFAANKQMKDIIYESILCGIMGYDEVIDVAVHAQIDKRDGAFASKGVLDGLNQDQDANQTDGKLRSKHSPRVRKVSSAKKAA